MCASERYFVCCRLPMGWAQGQKGSRQGMGRQPMLGRPTNPATNRAEDAILKAYRDGLTAGSGKAKGDRVERTPPPPKEALQPRQGKNAEFWNCQHCQEPNLPIHRWCYCCREPRHGAWSKGSGKGAAASKSAPKNASPKEPVIVIQEVEATPVQTAIEAERTALGKTLATMGLVSAPPVDQLKPYPRPKGRTVDGEGKGKALALAQGKVRSLQASLDTAKLQHPTSVIEAFTKELAAAKPRRRNSPRSPRRRRQRMRYATSSRPGCRRRTRRRRQQPRDTSCNSKQSIHRWNV